MYVNILNVSYDQEIDSQFYQRKDGKWCLNVYTCLYIMFGIILHSRVYIYQCFPAFQKVKYISALLTVLEVQHRIPLQSNQ